MQPAGRIFIFLYLKTNSFIFRSAMINVSKVAAFKPNGANYIDDDTTINTEQVNWMLQEHEILESYFDLSRNYGRLVQPVIVKVMKKSMLEVRILFGPILFEIFNVLPIWNLQPRQCQKK